MASLTVDGEVGVPVGKDVELVADVIRPSGPGRHPAVLMRTPYDRTSYASVGLQVNALRLARAGYAVVLQDVRGRFASSGEFAPFLNEQADGIATIEWIVGQPWSNGLVGMAGISYNAFAQLAVAVRDPEPLGAWVPALGPFDVRTSWIREGGAFNYGFHLAWGLGSVLGGGPGAALADPMGTALRGVEGQVELHREAAWFGRWAAADDPYPGDPRVPGSGDLASVGAPALVVAGWYDLFQPGTIELYRALEGETTHRHSLVVGPWDHSGLPLSRRSGDVDFGMEAGSDLHELQLAWFDHHLRGGDPPASPVRIFVTGINRWESLDGWPPPGDSVAWYPGPGGVLDPSGTGDGEIVMTLDAGRAPPALGGRVFPWEPVLRPGGFDQNARRARPDVAAFTSAPLARPLLAMGPVGMEVAVASSVGGTDVCAVLVDVAPDGSAINVADGVVRTVVPPGEVVTVRLSLGDVAHRFGAGHRLGVDLSAAAFPRYDLAFAPGDRTLHLGHTRLVLPEVR